VKDNEHIVKTYWWEKQPNFGDALSKLLIKHFMGSDATWTPAADADLVMVGSVLEQLSKDWSGIIAGAGKLHKKSKISFPNARILAVRGPLTAIGLRGDFVRADPGLLADELVDSEDKQYKLGIIPHWTDKTLIKDPRFFRYNPRIIRVEGEPLEVIREIGRCEKIISSSLHGIILADAFGTPRRIEIAPRLLTHAHQEGGLFKWLDYSASINTKLQIGVTQQIDRHKVADLQSELFDVMEELRRYFGNGEGQTTT
jgi:pyruvyltransferase